MDEKTYGDAKMTMGFILNGEDVTVDCDPESALVDILRDNFNLLGVKVGCSIGACGTCLIIFNGNVVKSCLIPALNIRGCEIITIEGFSQTIDYQDIILGFSETGLENCGFCDTGRIFATEALLSRNKAPSREEILSAFKGIHCRCTEPEGLVQGVLAASEHRRRRLYGHSAR
jgi:aerobic carbon-monoxide dehydrogenase small subunit